PRVCGRGGEPLTIAGRGVRTEFTGYSQRRYRFDTGSLRAGNRRRRGVEQHATASILRIVGASFLKPAPDQPFRPSSSKRLRRVQRGLVALVALLAAVTAAGALAGPATAGTVAYVVNNSDDSVTPVDVATGETAEPIDVGDAPWGIAVNPQGTLAYVANTADGS